MTQDIQNFIQYLHQEKNTSENTEVSYARDLKKMNQYLLTQGICDVNEVTATSLTSYVIYLEKEGRKPATISRSIASMKAFYHYMEKERRLAVDPSERLKAPRIEKKMPTVLTTEEVTRLLEQPGGTSPKELRDKAMLELLYATGIRVSELISLRVSDVNLRMEYLTCSDGHKERIIPFGTIARKALEEFLCYTDENEHNVMVSRFLSVVRKEQRDRLNKLRVLGDDCIWGEEAPDQGMTFEDRMGQNARHMMETMMEVTKDMCEKINKRDDVFDEFFLEEALPETKEEAGKETLAAAEITTSAENTKKPLFARIFHR